MEEAMAFLHAWDQLTIIWKKLQKPFGGGDGDLMDEDWPSFEKSYRKPLAVAMEATKDSSPWNDDDDDLTREHVDGRLATDTKSHPRRICVLIVQINLKLMLI